MRDYIWKEDAANKILLLDDSERALRTLKNIILSYKRLGYDVVTVATAEEAMEQLERIGSELCAFLIDQKIGEEPEAGIELLEFVGSEYNDIPAVVYTGARHYVREKAMEKGALLYVPLEEISRSRSLMEVMLDLFGRIRDARHLRNQFQKVIDTLGDELAVLDPEGRLLMLNKRKRDKFGLGDHEWHKLECWKVFKDQKCLQLGRRPEDCPARIVTEDPNRRQHSAEWHDPESRDFDDKRIHISASAIMDQKNPEKVVAVVEQIRPLTKMENLARLIEEVQKYDGEVAEKSDVSLLQYAADKLREVMEYSRVRMHLREFRDGIWQTTGRACSGMPSDFDVKQLSWPIHETPFNGKRVIFRDWPQEYRYLSERVKDDLGKIGMPEKSLVAMLQIHKEHEGEIAVDYGPKDTPMSDRELDEEDQRVLNIFSSYLAEKMEDIWYEEILKKLERADKLLVGSVGPESMLDSIVDLALEFFGAQNCLVRVKTNGTHWVIKALIEGEEISVGHCPLPANVGVCGRAISGKNAEFVVDTRSNEDFEELGKYMLEHKDTQWKRRRDRIESLAIGVLLHGEDVIGTITLEYYEKKAFTNREKQLFRRFCDKAAIAFFRTEELSRAIQNTGRTIELVGSALGHEADAMGRELGMIADDLKEFIQGNEDVDVSELSSDIDNLKRLQSELQNIMNIMKELPQHKDMNAICRSLIKMYKTKLDNSNISAELKLAEQIPKVSSEEKAISILFALLNLISNALDAMKDDIKDHHVLRIGTFYEPKNWRVLLTVEDNGKGISKEDLPRVFDPRFSTKGDHGGMGLSLTRTLMENLGGKVEVESKENEYTTFRIFIPWEAGD